jgi:hypothetical protein
MITAAVVAAAIMAPASAAPAPASAPQVLPVSSVTHVLEHETPRAAPPSAVMPPGMRDDIPNLFRQPAGCHSIVQQELRRQQVAFHGDRPMALYAVDRKLDGCSVPTPVGYHPDVPAPGATEAPKREDAPSNKR